jgi:excisionase family DNA binding protein
MLKASSENCSNGPVLKRLFKISEAATYLAISPITLYHWVAKREIPVVRLRRKAVRIDREVLDRMIKNSTMQTAKDAKDEGTLQARRDLVADILP